MYFFRVSRAASLQAPPPFSLLQKQWLTVQRAWRIMIA
jgi:hypothetical protein